MRADLNLVVTEGGTMPTIKDNIEAKGKDHDPVIHEIAIAK